MKRPKKSTNQEVSFSRKYIISQIVYIVEEHTHGKTDFIL